MVKNLPAVQEPWVRVLGCEDPLEKEIATQSSSLSGRNPRTEEPGDTTGHTAQGVSNPSDAVREMKCRKVK